MVHGDNIRETHPSTRVGVRDVYNDSVSRREDVSKVIT